MLKVGINWLSPHTFPIVQRLLGEGVADFCEIMVDNAVHLSPEKILNALPDVPLALHIVNSNFLTRPIAGLEDIAQHLRPWIEALQPFYVSDHLPQLDYANDFESAAARVSVWQELLGTKLLIENAASMQPETASQAEFYARLIEQTQCGLLFDFSNAYIAEHNAAQQPAPSQLSSPRRRGSIPNSTPLCAWAPILQQIQHFHIAGFHIGPKTNLAYDTHDTPITDDVFVMMQNHFAQSSVPESIVFELDARLDYELARQEILRIKASQLSFRESVLCDRGISRRSLDIKSMPRDDKVENAMQQLIKFVTEWSLCGLEHISAKGIIVRCKELPSRGVGLWKSTEPNRPAKVVTLDISRLNLPPADAYAISYQLDSWDGVEWIEWPMLQSPHP